MTFLEPAAATVLQTSFQMRKAIYDSNVLHAGRDQCGIFPCWGEFGGPRSLIDGFGWRESSYKSSNIPVACTSWGEEGPSLCIGFL